MKKIALVVVVGMALAAVACKKGSSGKSSSGGGSTPASSPAAAASLMTEFMSVVTNNVGVATPTVNQTFNCESGTVHASGTVTESSSTNTRTYNTTNLTTTFANCLLRGYTFGSGSWTETFTNLVYTDTGSGSSVTGSFSASGTVALSGQGTNVGSCAVTMSVTNFTQTTNFSPVSSSNSWDYNGNVCGTAKTGHCTNGNCT